MKKKITKANEFNNMVNYTIEDAEASLKTMIELTLSEFDVACDKIDAEYENQNSISSQVAAEE